MPTMDEFQSAMIDRLARIETTLAHMDSRLAGYEPRIAKLEARVPDPDHESRLRKLERAVWLAAGAASAGGGIVGAIVSQVTGA